ncbi:D-alanyl-lipoteichoic acid acyltransferase DltB, MBOAT superfamily [Caloramator quimbayensis]|uniref:D-alanyl-lipoteichoic acid acyltransferase DltB, MBOAT superfamily n=1 Tax=Caloramator quimbayensis TaxID=1147123 RepID=A0A1T4Y5K7_9CLOT|nr:MBOAT family O-acyltransferase [Caloramator quimbayensis]SKA96788.1 D-alanyl-lipoteichoic acid acyltransferase DltB, MBOAT superfamily [Caloramator quimbayensis]
MLFNSVDFAVFFPFAVFVYFIMPKRFRWVWLLISSYIFYMSYSVKYTIFLVISTLVTYLSGILIERADNIKDERKSIKLKKTWVFLSFAINLGILFVFKYSNFFNSLMQKLLSNFNIALNTPKFNYLLPLGISFYTFQALSYTVDVYRKDVKVQRNLAKYALFVSFFPQVIAGPIGKSKHLLHQFDEEYSFDYDRIKNGLLLMLWGFFQKLFVADRLAILVNTVYSEPSKYKGFEIIIANIFFAIQIYCDFCGYSDIARGIAEILGIRLYKNFERPYFSKSIKEFWRRWHISLSTWFRDYLYIPLGGKRCSKIRNYINIMIVFLVSGLWHGAAVNFIIWGALHGAYLILSDIFKPIKKGIVNKFNIKTDTFSYKFFQIIITFILVDFAWIFFKADSFTNAKIIIKNMNYFNPFVLVNGDIYKLGLDSKDFFIALLGIAVILIVNILQRNKSLRLEISKQNCAFRWVLYFAAIIVILIFGIYGPAYSAKQFIYSQF